MVNPIFIGLGILLLLLGVVSIFRPQSVANVGAKQRYEDAHLTDSGQAEQRRIGIIVIVVGVMLILGGVSV
jgi:uncharacterized protein YjeT (DUF2065 family)